MSVQLALLATLEAKPGKEEDVVSFLQTGRELVQHEVGTVTWYAIRLGPTTFGIFDTFENEEGRQAHLAGEVAQALQAKGPELFAADPDIRQVDVIATKAG